MIDIAALLKQGAEMNASDLHLRAEAPPVFRVDGVLRVLDGAGPVSNEDLEAALQKILDERGRKRFQERNECDFAFSVPGAGRFRGNCYRQRGTIGLALRHVPTEIPTPEQLHLPPVVFKLAEEPRGLVLVTGTTGSGKSTTLASMVDHINRNKSVHIVTIEDPIEFLHRDRKAILSQREIGFDTFSYADALRHVVRQDPDVILIGEIRDPETVMTALSAALTGHLVLSTLHTIDAVQTVSRMVDMFPPHQQNQVRLMLADTLKGVISLRLLPHASGKGRVPAVEVLVVTALVRKHILENNMSEVQTAMRQGEYYGMQTFQQALIRLYREGKAHLPDVLAVASNPEEIMLHVRGIQTDSGARV